MNGLSDKDREYLEFGKAEMDRRKADLIGRIVANVEDPAKKASVIGLYTNMSIPQLEDVLLTIPQQSDPNSLPSMPTVNGVPIPDYSGRGVPVTNANRKNAGWTPGKALEFDDLYEESNAN